MLAVTLGASLAIVKVATLMNTWDKKFYDAIEKFEKDLMLPLVGEFLVYTAVIVLFIVIGNWFKKHLVAREPKRRDGKSMAKKRKFLPLIHSRGL